MTRGQQGRHPNRRQGAFAERWVAEQYELEHAPNEAEWYDAVDPASGTKYEVKSTRKTIDTRDPDAVVPGPGRFRVWYDQHRRLAARDAQEDTTAWYVFVLLDGDGDSYDVVDHRRMHPTTLTPIVGEYEGGWDTAGHDDRASQQQKIPWQAVFQ